MSSERGLSGDLTVDVLIVGGGPSGLSAATALAHALPAGRVALIDRESATGGIPRHSDHLGFGMRDLRTFISGPAYARRLTDRALQAGARLYTQTMATDWADSHTVAVTSPGGRRRVHAGAIVLATGARERSRAGRMIPGYRGPGIYTTGQLQNLVHLHHRSPGECAVVVGAEMVSWSAVLTLRTAGCRVVSMISAYDRPETYAAVSVLGRLAFGVPVAVRSRLTRIIGADRVSAVEIERLDTGELRLVECDTVILTGSWVGECELARTAGLEMDGPAQGPVVDNLQETSTAGIFAIGNLTHPVDTAGVAAQDGVAVAPHVLEYLRQSPRKVARPDSLRITAGSNLRWITPGRLRDTLGTARNGMLCWPGVELRRPQVTVTQNGHVIARRVLSRSASPGRVLHLPATLLAGAVAQDGPAVVSLADATENQR
ncbi:MAG: FAD-dependent oxidoreductase [Rubrivivax sp.]|nr:FAD-dependent oxidoreductase [Rubrivivax sp.]